MKGIPQDIREIDLMAYADGLLESDTARKNAVEAYLESHPSEAARVATIIEDNRAIRELYAAEIGRPVPQWLLRTVREPAPRRRRSSVAIAASVFLTALAAGGGWFVGQHREVTSVSAELLQAVAGEHTKPRAQTAVSMAAADGSGALLSELSRNVLIEVPAPDLSVHGFGLAERSLVTVAGEKMVRLVYRSSSGVVNLFMRLRQHTKTTATRRFRADDVYVHYWSEGPLAYALTTDAQASGTQLAQAVRNTIKPGRFIEQPPASVPGQGESMAADGALGVQQPAEPASPSPQPSQFN
ncbi:anti-sigma factor family protein [Nitratireductor sp. GCM10026969]|uniref:anti-sigma factor family protein n=1 Tax=Nitratireductor sp. GCM10026969 TaxID=3252645 RepID=UPI0036177572